MPLLTIRAIRDFPTVVEKRVTRVGDNQSRMEDAHESCFRSYQVLQRVKWLLAQGCSPAVVLQEIEEMEGI